MRRDFKFLTPTFTDSVSALAHDTSPDEVIDENIEEDKEETKTLAAYLREDDKEETPIIATTDVNDWIAEYNHVKDRLKDGKKGESGDYMFKIKRMKKYLEKIKSLASNSGSQALQTYVYVCENALNSITIAERQLNKQANQELVEEMHKIKGTKVEAAHELIDLRNKVKFQIDEFDTLVDKCNAILVLLA